MALTLTHTLATGTTASATEVQQNFDDVVNKFDGNVDETDLKYPYSIVEWSSSIFNENDGTDYLSRGVRNVGGTSGATAGFANTVVTTQGAAHEVINSVRKADRAYTVVTARASVIFQGHTSGEVFTINLQTASDPDATWTTIGTGTATVPVSGNSTYQNVALTVSSPVIALAKYVRFTLVNPSGVFTAPAGTEALLPQCVFQLTLKTGHIA